MGEALVQPPPRFAPGHPNCGCGAGTEPRGAPVLPTPPRKCPALGVPPRDVAGGGALGVAGPSPALFRVPACAAYAQDPPKLRSVCVRVPPTPHLPIKSLPRAVGSCAAGDVLGVPGRRRSALRGGKRFMEVTNRAHVQQSGTKGGVPLPRDRGPRSPPTEGKGLGRSWEGGPTEGRSHPPHVWSQRILPLHQHRGPRWGARGLLAHPLPAPWI